MMIFFVVALILMIIVLIPLIAYNTNTWTPAVINPVPIADANQAYNIPAAWTPSQPVGNSTCQVYTFPAVNNNIPQPNIRDLNAAASNIQPINGTCVDADQLFAQNVYHICKYGEFQNVPASQFSGCLKNDGVYTKVDGYYEEYFAPCGAPAAKKVGTQAYSEVTAGTSTQCPGSVGLIMFDYQASIAGGICLREPVYTVDGSGIIIPPDASLTVAKVGKGPSNGGVYPDPALGCNIGETQNGFPSQLFRVTRHSYNGSSFSSDDTGPWINIVHRPTGKYVAPYTLSNTSGNNTGKPLAANFIPSLPPILVPGNSFSGKGSWWYMSPDMLMPESFIRGVRPFPDPMLPSTIVGGPDWDGLYWADQRRGAKPQLVWAPDPNAIYELKSDVDLWTYLTNDNGFGPANKTVYSLAPFIKNGLDMDFSAMSMVPFLTYQLVSGTPADNVLPITNAASIFYPTQLGLQDFATVNRFDPASGCLGYNPAVNGRIEPSPLNPSQSIVVPLTWHDSCNQNYVKNLFQQYSTTIAPAKDRVMAETASFQYVDLSLYPIIMYGVANYFDTANNSA